MSEKHNQPACLVCNTTSDEVPLISLYYRGQDFWICPQHLPILIHKPSQLADQLPGAENFQSAAGHEH